MSLAESQDAWRAMQHLGIVDKDTFRLSLRSTLIKEADDRETFEELFALYFGAEQPPMNDMQANLSPDEQQMLEDAMDELARPTQLLNWLLNGQNPTREELEELSAGRPAERPLHGAGRAVCPRMQRLLGWDRLEELLELLWELLAEQGMEPDKIEELKAQAAENMESLRQQLEQYAGQAIGEQMVEEYPEKRQSVNDLMHRPFESLTAEDIRRLREAVHRLAARLRTRVSLRQKRGKVGKLDAKSTIRANLRYGGVPMELHFKTRRLKPRLVTFLDVSTSMRPVTEFFLWLLYELQDQVQRARSFAFIDHLEEVSDDLHTFPPDEAMERIVSRLPPGHYNTDFGRSLQQFQDQHLDALDSHTTVIVLGDARNNYNDPALRTMDEIRRRSRRTIWLNPEYPAQWGTGDSDMLDYVPLCNEVFQVRNLAQLAEAIDRLLAA